jgi:hypothetical protein
MGAEIYGNIGFKQHRVQGNMGGIEQQNGEQWELVIIVGISNIKNVGIYYIYTW